MQEVYLEGGRLRLIIAGHVDHGKSTLVGRLLADSGSLPHGRLETIRAQCEKKGVPFEYAFLLDTLADERRQGITIETSRIFFSSAARQYVIFDAPGHIEFIRNMVTGAAQADAAVLVVDAQAGVQDNTRRHAYLISLLGLRRLIVAANKMDLAGFSQDAFERLTAELNGYFASIGVAPIGVVPVSGRTGENIAVRGADMPWYSGPTLLEHLDQLPQPGSAANLPFRMHVQDVYRFLAVGEGQRIVAGTPESGALRSGDQVVFFPSGKKSSVAAIARFPAVAAAEEIRCGEAAGFTLAEQIYIRRGELCARAEERPPLVAARCRTTLFWLGDSPMSPDKKYTVKLGTEQVGARLESVSKTIDADSLGVVENTSEICRYQAAECTILFDRALAFDPAECSIAGTSRFVVVDGFRISGGGVIQTALADRYSEAREQALRRNTRWIESSIGEEDRAQRYGQQAVLILITGERRSDRKELAKALEASLFRDGRFVYFLAMGSLVYGLDADIKGRLDTGAEHVRRLAEVSNLLLDAGLIVVASAAELLESDIALIRELLGADRVIAVWLGAGEVDGFDLRLEPAMAGEALVERIKDLVQRRQRLGRRSSVTE